MNDNQQHHLTFIPYGLNPLVLPVLPSDLVHAVNQTFFLHLLTLVPDKILPPGKSLISVVTQEQLGDFQHDHGGTKASVTAAVQQQVTEVMQTAFWDVTAEKLSSPEPSEQNIHIKQLLNDIREAVSPLMPPQDQLVHVLSLPPAPSIAPLYSFMVVMKDVLTTLRRRCAPIHDDEIDAELRLLDSLPFKPHFTVPESTQHTGTTTAAALPIAKLVTQSLRATMTIIDHMKSDLHNLLLGTMTEEQLRSLIMREAKLRERDLTIKLWSPHRQKGGRGGEEIIREGWRMWCRPLNGGDTTPEEERWKLKLLMALTSPKPVSCIPPQDPTAQPSTNTGLPSQNVLPPQFFFSITFLYKLQDYMQAVVIAATLRSLVRLSTPSSFQPIASAQTSGHDFMQRVWDLLEAELYPPLDAERADESSLRLVNLEDEVIRARRTENEVLDPSEEGKLREAVKRTLQSSDPVFLLLQKRLLNALLKGIVAGPSRRNGARIPDHLVAGRGHPNESDGKRLKLMLDDEAPANLREITFPSIVGLTSPVKGFEDPVLVKALGEAFGLLGKIIGWTENVWGDLI